MKKSITILLMLICCHGWVIAQRPRLKASFWKVVSYNGEIRLNGFYRNQIIKRTGFSEQQESRIYSAGIFLNTRNYIWHPKFLLLDIQGEYSPNISKENFLVIPDQSESRNIEKLDARLSFLPQNKISFTSYFNYSQGNTVRENLSTIKNKSTGIGTTLFYTSKKIPVSISYTNWNQQEHELQTGRKFQSRQQILEGRASSSIGKRYKQELIISHNRFFRRDYNKSEVTNTTNNLIYNSQAYPGKRKSTTFNTGISCAFQKGNETYNRYQFVESMNKDLKRNFNLSANYTYFSDQRKLQTVSQHKTGAGLGHQLFKSLHSQITYQYTTTQQSRYSEEDHRAQISFNYTKKVLKLHDLDISYSHSIQAQQWKSEDAYVNVLNESLKLRDGQISLLQRPYVTPGSIAVKDATGTILYQQNLDYRLITQNDFVQIQRVPGGLIPDNSTVYVDYTAQQPGSYRFNSTNYQVSAGLYFFNRLFGFYYRKSKQDYDHLKKTGLLTLNYFDQQLMGARIDFRFISAGAEYEDMKSVVLPYQLYRYFINVQGPIGNRLIVGMNGNLYDYKKLNLIRNVQYADMSGSAMYSLNDHISILGTVNYRKQQGEGSDLDLFGFGTTVNAVFHKLNVSLLYNYYDRTVVKEKLQFNSVHLRISRKF